MSHAYDAVLLVSFGGPEGPDDVEPFLDNVLRGRAVSAERRAEVARHYARFGGVSPLNAQNRRLRERLEVELAGRGCRLPVYWGNRNWRPLLGHTLAEMARQGVRRALAFVTSAFGSYSGCRQYLDDLTTARAALGDSAPSVDKVRLFYNHPEFLGPIADRLHRELDRLPASRQERAEVFFTAHSIPESAAAASPYVRQLQEACAWIATASGVRHWHLAYQSRSGTPSQPWLEPDVGAAVLDARRLRGTEDVLVAPIGFVSDHLEVIYDLDVELRSTCEAAGVRLVRLPTVGEDPRFVAMVADLILERLDPARPRPASGSSGPWPDVCPAGCCEPRRPIR